MPGALCVIPARGGSARIPGKNIRRFHGRPILSYSIRKAGDSELFDRIVVSTDSLDVAAVARENGAEVIMRDGSLPDGDVGTQERTAQAIRQTGWAGEYTCCIYATAPLMSVSDLRRGHDLLVRNMSADFVYSASPTDHSTDAAQFYWGATQAFADGRNLWGGRTLALPIRAERVCDINTPADWDQAERMYADLERERLANGIPECIW